MDRSDKALVTAFLLAAGLGTWTRCLMHDDGAIILSSGWLGSLWDLYIGQIATRAVAVFAMHGPAWLARAAFDLDDHIDPAVAGDETVAPGLVSSLPMIPGSTTTTSLASRAVMPSPSPCPHTVTTAAVGHPANGSPGYLNMRSSLSVLTSRLHF